MELSEYQSRAVLTDQVPQQEGEGLVIPLLGLAGEVGSLVSEYKKLLRDGPAHRLFKEQFAEELGDVLWYLADVATKFDLDLDVIARQNLEKTQDRWPSEAGRGYTGPIFFDAGFPDNERLPQRFVAEIVEEIVEPGKARIKLLVDGAQIGSKLTDNAYADDGYRFHDVFHLAHVAHLGWSPVLRGLLDRKRRSDAEIDEVEDGGRAGVIDEAVVAMVFDYARKHEFLEGVDSVDYHLLKRVRSLTSGLEVRARSAYEWEQTILAGYKVWRKVRENHGGRIVIDVEARAIEYVSEEASL